MIDFQTVGVSISGSTALLGALLKLFVRSEARSELKDDIKCLHERCNSIEDDYVECKHCKSQHDNSDKNFEKMDKKLDMILETILKKI